jgi:hypothetical protein
MLHCYDFYKRVLTRIVFSACFTSSEIYFVHFSVCFFLRSIFGHDFSQFFSPPVFQLDFMRKNTDFFALSVYKCPKIPCPKKSSLHRLATPTRLGPKEDWYRLPATHGLHFLVWGTSCEHNFSWTFRLPRVKIVLIFRSQHPPYWWCLVCRTASRGASSLGCLRKSR